MNVSSTLTRTNVLVKLAFFFFSSHSSQNAPQFLSMFGEEEEDKLKFHLFQLTCTCVN